MLFNTRFSRFFNQTSKKNLAVFLLKYHHIKKFKNPHMKKKIYKNRFGTKLHLF